MYEWQRQIQQIVEEIDYCIEGYNDEALTLRRLARKMGYSEFYATRKFKEISGMSFRDYLRQRKLAFALKEVRDKQKSFLDIAFDYGFSSHEAFTRAFKRMYGVAPSEYRREPKPVVLRTRISSFDRYFLGLGEIGMMKSDEDNPNIIEGASSWFDIQAPHEITFNLDGEPLSGQNFHIEILPAALRCRLPPDCPLLR